MHPSQKDAFRKAITILLTLAFSGGLLAFTGLANLNLLQSLYPDPQFVIFGLLALEGGVLYWTAYYLLVRSGAHKGIAAFALGIDALISGVGFFYEMQRVTNGGGTVELPPVTYVIATAVVFNVAMSIVGHLYPDTIPAQYIAYTPAPAPQGPKEPDNYYVPATFEQTGQASQTPAPRRPGLLQSMAANVIAGTADTLELARQLRQNRPQTLAQAPQAPALQAPQETTVQEEKAEPVAIKN